MIKEYSTEDKLAGLDLHGLSCRVPKPTLEQAGCSHSEWEESDQGFENWMTGEWVSDIKMIEVGTFVDIPGTHNFRCTQCGYTRRY